MKRIFITTILSVAFFSLLQAQDKQFKLAKKTGTLVVNLSGVKIEGYDGSEIIFSAPKHEDNTKDERADGLKLINGSDYSDNTGLNLSVQEDGNNVQVRNVSKTGRDLLTIKVPNTMSVKISTHSVMDARSIDVRDFKGELEIGAVYNAISLDNVTGPVNAKTIYGSLTAKFSSSVKGPISLVSVYKFVDAAIPASLSANVNLSTQYGNIYAADGLDIKRDISKSAKNDDDDDLTGLINWGKTSDIKGTLNGGGLDLILKSSYGKIYLRKN